MEKLSLVREVEEIANDLLNLHDGSSTFPSVVEAYQIAVKIQQNRILEDIFLIRGIGPGAIEAIAMQLGAPHSSSSIPDAIYRVADALDNIIESK
jgi:hypothetical protein